jgi:hypothetical protein
VQPWWSGFAAELLGLLHEPFEAFLEKANKEFLGLGLKTRQGDRLQLVSDLTLSSSERAMGYEHFVAQTGQIPTRDSRHDRLNALVWISAPLSKQRLNALHAKALQSGVSGVSEGYGPPATVSATTARPIDKVGGQGRGALRDALTLIDENLMVVVAQTRAAELQNLLEAHNWQELFVTNRDAWLTEWKPLVFGHALLEKLDAPFKAITAHCLVIPSDQASMILAAGWHSLDRLLSDQLDENLCSRRLGVLPVMGLPGWCPDNEDPDFYRDTKVFRPKRHPQAVV